MDDEDDFFAYQTTKSLNSKRSRLKQFLQAPPTSVQSKKQQDEESTSNSSDFDNDDNLIGLKKSKRPPVHIIPPALVVGSSAAHLPPPSTSPSKPQDSIRTEIDAIVTSCFASNNKDHEKTRRKIQLSKRTAADDQDFDEEVEREYYGNQFSTQMRGGRAAHMSRTVLGRRQLQGLPVETDGDKVTRETAAYDRLDAVLRVTKPLCEKQIDSIDDDDEQC